jgi:NAD(P)-dependent dehydrogenase (short-subunit alcohol dehydrogenase family)
MNTTAGQHAAAVLSGEGLSATFETLDVRDPGQSVALVDKLVRERERIDIWVNNAGVWYEGPAEIFPRSWWDESLAVMLSGAFYCSQAVGKQMVEQGSGVIVNVASVDGYQPVEGHVAFSVAKAGIVMLTQALGIEWARSGVRVVGVAPGPLKDEPIGGVVTGGTAMAEVYERRTPMRRLGSVEEAAEAVLFLVSDKASYLTAEVLRVDGGWVAYQLF